MKNEHINLIGWILFIISAIGFIIASIGSFWSMVGSIFFLLACLVFLIPFFRKDYTDLKFNLISATLVYRTGRKRDQVIFLTRPRKAPPVNILQTFAIYKCNKYPRKKCIPRQSLLTFDWTSLIENLLLSFLLVRVKYEF